MTKKSEKAPAKKNVYEVLLRKDVTIEKTVFVVAESEDAVEEAARSGEFDELLGEGDFDYMDEMWHGVTAENVDELDEEEAKSRIRRNSIDHEVDGNEEEEG